MEDSAKYLIHATVEADGVVERSDVVGAVFGQTEGLLGEELDLRRLKESSKVGRIHVDVESQAGRSEGELTIASNLDRVETAVLAAALETIDRVGPCHAEFAVTGIEDVRAAKRRKVVDRAKELLETSFDDSVPTTQELLEEVRRTVRVEDITEYEGLPAGPNVATSDAIVVVEGRADVLQLLKHGIKNGIAVEGTDVPEAVGELTEERTVTAFFDGDRGGDLILEELSQVGDVDYVAIAPPDRSVEELDRDEVMAALRDKIPYENLDARGGLSTAATDGSARPAPGGDASDDGPSPETASAESTTEESTADGESATSDEPDGHADEETDRAGNAGQQAEDDTEAERASETADEAKPEADESQQAGESQQTDEGQQAGSETGEEPRDESTPTEGSSGEASSGDPTAESTEQGPETVRGHVEAVVGGSRGTVRLLDEDAGLLGEAPAEEAFDRVEAADPVPATVVLDGVLSQRVLDVAAQRGVRQVVAHEFGDFVKRPTNVRIRTAEQVLAS